MGGEEIKILFATKNPGELAEFKKLSISSALITR